MKRILFFLLTLFSINITAQSPLYPDAEKGFKRVDLLLPKIDDNKNYKVEVKFSYEVEVIECASVSFSIKPDNLKPKYAIPNAYRYPYYDLKNGEGDISQGITSDCTSKTKAKKKIYSSQNIFIEYQSYYPIPFYISEGWSVEYRVWKVSDSFTTVK